MKSVGGKRERKRERERERGYEDLDRKVENEKEGSCEM